MFIGVFGHLKAPKPGAQVRILPGAPNSLPRSGSSTQERTEPIGGSRTPPRHRIAAKYAESYRVVVTPSGKVHASSSYPAEVIDCG